MKRTLISLLLALIALSLQAAKSRGTVRIFAQPDGTTISVRLLGDEHFSWYQTLDGVLLTRTDNVFYIARTGSDGKLSSTGVLAHDAGARDEKELKAAIEQDKRMFLSYGSAVTRASRKAKAGYPASFYCPHNGTVRVPVILMEYPDMPFTITDRTVWANYFNDTTRTVLSADSKYQGYGSVRRYFSDASGGKLDMVFDLYGPYTASKPHDSYGKASGNSFSLLKEAVNLADDVIDFTKYDSDADGKVDMVYILYAGTGANLSSNDHDFWPGCFSTASRYFTADGLDVNIIGGANELISGSGLTMRAGVGVTCHEMSHGLGMPDLYWTLTNNPMDDEGYVDFNNCGPEDWDLMDGGENLYNSIWPCQYTAWEREAMGWIEAEELTQPATVTLWPLNKEGGKAYRVTNPDNANEYYIIENYQRDEWNEYISRLYGYGLMITHVNTSDTGLTLTPNNTYGRPNVTILPADGYILGLYSRGQTINYRGELVTMPGKEDSKQFLNDYYYPEMRGDPYDGSKSASPVTSLAAYHNYTGEDMVSKYPITDITRNSDGSITFQFMGGTVPSAISHTSSGAASSGLIYSIDGRCVGTSTANLPHGTYIRDQKKFVK